MPAYIRARPASCTMASRLSAFAGKNALNISTAAPEKQLCADGYDAWLRKPIAGISLMAGSPSRGRINHYACFASQPPTPPPFLDPPDRAGSGPSRAKGGGHRPRDRLRAHLSAHGVPPREVGMRLPRSRVRLSPGLVLEELRVGRIEGGQPDGRRARDRPTVGLEPAA